MVRVSGSLLINGGTLTKRQVDVCTYTFVGYYGSLRRTEELECRLT